MNRARNADQAARTCERFMVYIIRLYDYQTVVTELDTPKSDYREKTGTEWLVLGLGWG